MILTSTEFFNKPLTLPAHYHYVSPVRHSSWELPQLQRTLRLLISSKIFKGKNYALVNVLKACLLND